MPCRNSRGLAHLSTMTNEAAPRFAVELWVTESLTAIVRGAHPSKTAKGEAAKVVLALRWGSPLKPLDYEK